MHLICSPLYILCNKMQWWFVECCIYIESAVMFVVSRLSEIRVQHAASSQRPELPRQHFRHALEIIAYIRRGGNKQQQQQQQLGVYVIIRDDLCCMTQHTDTFNMRAGDSTDHFTYGEYFIY